MMEQIERVALHFGGKNQLATMLGVSLASISKWKKYLPMGRAYQIEVLSNGTFKAKELISRGGEHG